MAATLKDLAKETGLSIATISKYINGVKLKEANSIAIEAAIKKLDYTVNEYARSLKMNKSYTIGIIVPELANIFMAQIITKIEEILREKGYSSIICDCHKSEEQECQVAKFMQSKMVDGIINMPTCSDGRHLQPFIEKNIPVILIDREIESLETKLDSVLVDNEKAVYEGTKHLIENGHRDIAVVVGPENIFTSKSRLKGYKSALSDNNIKYYSNLTVYSDYTVQGGYEALKSLLQIKPSLSAIFVTNYEMTLGAIIYANEQGINIPQQLSFIGFDNMELSKVINPKLTIVTQPLEAIALETAKLMLHRISKDFDSDAIKITLETSLETGNSVSDLRGM